MKYNDICKFLSLLIKLIQFFMIAAYILNKYPESITKGDIIIEKNKFSIKICKIMRFCKSTDSIEELLEAGLLNCEECADKNFHQITYCKGNVQKYLAYCYREKLKERIFKDMRAFIYGKK